VILSGLLWQVSHLVLLNFSVVVHLSIFIKTMSGSAKQGSFKVVTAFVGALKHPAKNLLAHRSQVIQNSHLESEATLLRTSEPTVKLFFHE
jgi:hypothetical protein